MKMFCDGKSIKLAEKCFKQLKINHKPNEYIYCILMRAYADLKNHIRVLELYAEMKQAGFQDSELSRRYLIVSCAGIPSLQAGVLDLYRDSYKNALKEYEKTGKSDTELIVIFD
jgi:pentatricopeptide repeat protein